MKSRLLILLGTAFCLLTGCIREDRSDCSCDVFLDFLYTGDGQTDIFPDKIDKVNMYVYSAADRSLAGEYELDKAALTEHQGIHLYLRPGNYRIVCWGNAADRTHIHKVYDEAKVAEPVWFKSDEFFTGNDELYFSELEISVPETLRDVEGTCNFECSHIDMYVQLKGFKGAIGPDGQEADIVVAHTGLPAYTDFFNVPAQDERCEVIPEIQDDPDNDDSYILKYHVLRFSEQEETAIDIRDLEGNSILDEGPISVTDFIRNYGVVIDDVQEASVAIKLTLGPVGVEVADWNIVDVKPGFD